MFDVLIIGTGYIGTAMADYYCKKGFSVAGLTRSEEHAIRLKELNIHPIIGDMTQPGSLSGLPVAKRIIFSQAPDHRNPMNYRNTYIRGVANVLSQLHQNQGPQMLLYCSSTGVWGQDLNGWVDESIIPEPQSAFGKILFEAENQILACDYPTIILRLSGIYGPHRNRIQVLKEGKWPAELPDKYVNMIHRDDIIGIIDLLLNKGRAGNVYLGSDDTPNLRSDICQWLCMKLQIKSTYAPHTDPNNLGKRIKNGRIKDLGYQFKYPDFISGYSSILS
ncbi:MAG: NAD-dependent epimerase/dehydratase family protein [Chlamydiota bacterium]|nr:NAD-dependent epimerase/dehydratase family protein [Chlamydiota bacterium]